MPGSCELTTDVDVIADHKRKMLFSTMTRKSVILSFYHVNNL